MRAKLIRENITQFKRGMDSKSILGFGEAPIIINKLEKFMHDGNLVKIYKKLTWKGKGPEKDFYLFNVSFGSNLAVEIISYVKKFLVENDLMKYFYQHYSDKKVKIRQWPLATVTIEVDTNDQKIWMKVFEIWKLKYPKYVYEYDIKNKI